MSKLDAQRAMREARYAAQQKAAGAPAQRRATRTRPPVAPDEAPVAAPAKAAKTSKTSTDDGACGHRSMNGRTCTRPSGHTEKNHRYG
ncbi:MAG: hypothetical protein CMH83_11835 [Nocardioides sp.]|nr:hypothetical protein [Nocardioides sp.]